MSAEHYRALVRFAKREGHARVPQKHHEGGLPLGVWVHRRRRDYKRGRLSPERIATLARLPGWMWEVARRGTFARMIDLLRGYVAREGHARVPQAHVEKGWRLGQWVAGRRQAHKRGRLPQAQERALGRLQGWTWQAGPPGRRAPFDVMLRALRRYVAREGHPRVPQGHVERDVPLGRWVHSRRMAYKGGKLPLAQIRALERVQGWAWRLRPTPPRRPFEAMLRLLRRFCAREGHAGVPRSHLERGVALGTWVDGRRNAYRQHRLPEAHARALQRLPGWSWRLRPAPRVLPFDAMLRLLRVFARREGHCLVPVLHVEGGERLGRWVDGRRQAVKKQRLPESQVRALERLRGWTWRVRPNWRRRPRRAA